MASIKGRHRRAAALGAALALAAVLSLAGCGKPGKIYGAAGHDGTWIDGALGGFPSSGYFGVYYEIRAGTYDLYWQLFDGSNYWPAYSYYWHATYTVEADGGKLFFVDGKDHYFTLYLGYDALYKGGDVKSAQAPKGSQTWTQDGLRITVGEPTRVSAAEFPAAGESQFRDR
jgi:hypothetical protein